MLSAAGVNVSFKGELDDGFEDAFLTVFSRRYLPDVSFTEAEPHIIVERFKGDTFRVFAVSYDEGNTIDKYKIESPVPSAYVNESPIFFLLQAVARAGAKIGKLFITDSVSISLGNYGVLFLGYPHSGKSTISTLALTEGFTILSTENTVIKPRKDGLYVVGGTDVLVYDPKIEEIYGVEVPYDDETKSGYRIKVIASNKRKKLMKNGVKIKLIVVLHAAFNCLGAGFSPVTGRKVKKILWYFATSLLKGVDYYEPRPLDVPITATILENINKFLTLASSIKMVEAFGNHKDILFRIINGEI